jgi:hypothetical protein
MAATGAVGADRLLVADQLAAAVESRRPIDQARTLLLAASCGELSDAAAVCRHAAEDRGAAIARGLGDPQCGRISVTREDGGKENYLRNSLKKWHLRALCDRAGQSSGSNLRLRAAWCCCDPESRSKIEIPAKMVIQDRNPDLWRSRTKHMATSAAS